MQPAYLCQSFAFLTISLPSRIIVDTDATAIASRVSRPRPDTTEIVINEQTIMNAYQTVKERVAQKIIQQM
jgi:hypothetical protein